MPFTADTAMLPHPPDHGSEPLDPQHPPVRYEEVDPCTADHRDYLLLQSRVSLMATSQMSDRKANLMLTLSAVMPQFALSEAADHTYDRPLAQYRVLAAGALVTILLCALSTMPKLPSKLQGLREDHPLPTGFNLLHFGHFVPLPLADFKRRMKQVLSSPPRTHDALMDERHAHGRFIALPQEAPLRMACFTFPITWLVAAGLNAMA